MDASYVQQYRDLWRNHWWWQSRHRLILDKLETLLPVRQPTEEPPQLLDIGCCGGVAFGDFCRFGDVQGLEPDPHLAKSLPAWRGRVEQADFHAGYQSDRRYDLILMLDVLEHIEDDCGALANVYRLLQPGGYYFMTVPALPALWSAHDDANHHFRRYRRAPLHQLLAGQGFEVKEVRYIFGWSLGLVYLRSWLSRHVTGPYSLRIPPRWANAPAYWLTRLEEWLTWGKGPPLGSSLLAIARKPQVEAGFQGISRAA